MIRYRNVFTASSLLRHCEFYRYHARVAPLAGHYRRSSTLSMGAASSKEAETDSKSAFTAVDQTTLYSAPCAKFFDPLDISVLLSEKQHADLNRAPDTPASWLVELELDVAHLQARHTLAVLPADRSLRLHRIRIPELAFRRVMRTQGVTVDSVCNISAVHVALYGDNKREKTVAETVVILDVSRDGYNSKSDAAGLIRRIYGVSQAVVE